MGNEQDRCIKTELIMDGEVTIQLEDVSDLNKYEVMHDIPRYTIKIVRDTGVIYELIVMADKINIDHI